MQLTLDNDRSYLVISGYSEGAIHINEERITSSVVVTPKRLLRDWSPADFEALTAAHFEALLEHQPELVLLGTGARLRFPAPALTAALIDAGIGVEVMDTAAACRTYNLLAGEQRRVVAALLML